MPFRDKVVLVTGAASGIGRAIALRFALHGANVAIHDLNVEEAQSTARAIVERGRRAQVYPVDVSDPAVVRQVVNKTLADFGHLHVLVNDAGINIVRHPFDFTDEEWGRVLGVNLTGTWNYCRYVGPHLVETGGSIVNIASVAATVASYYRVPYMASKGAVGMLTKALALDLAELGVRVNAVGPGVVETPLIKLGVKRFGGASREMITALTPMRRLAQPEEIAAAVLFLASDDARHITGQILMVDGGLTAGTQIGASWRPAAEDGVTLPWLTDSSS